MSGFDYVVFLVVGLAAITGFFRGFVEEVLALAAWCLAMLAVHYFHATVTALLMPTIANETGAGVLAFGMLLAVPYFATKVLARQMGSASRGSMLGPIDRVLGFGFGAIKGFVVMVLVFALMVFAFDVVWGPKGRPIWLREGRTYPFLNAASDELLTLIAQRRAIAVGEARAQAQDAGAGNDAGAGDGNGAADGSDPAPTPVPAPATVHHPRHRHHPAGSVSP